MKKHILLFVLFILLTSACVPTVSVEPTTVPADLATHTALPATNTPTLTPEPATPTPEIFIALTQAVPGELQPTQPAGTTVTYTPLTLTIPATIGSGASGAEIPRLDSDDAAWWQKTPGHLQVSLGDYYALQGKTHQPTIYVYPAAAYAELAPSAFESIHRLNNYLYDPANVPALAQLPGVPFFNAQIQFSAQIQQLSFRNGSGIRYITQYAQYAAPANNTDLFYNYIGLTNDGEYYIVAILPLTISRLAETSDANAPLPSGGIPYPGLGSPNEQMDPYYIAVTEMLNVQLPASFFPTLDELDSLIQSMQIEQ
jgi:hypothetical protein